MGLLDPACSVRSLDPNTLRTDISDVNTMWCGSETKPKYSNQIKPKNNNQSKPKLPRDVMWSLFSKF